jgi:hypothetical protein
MPHVLYLGDDRLLDFAAAAVDVKFSNVVDISSVLDRLAWECTRNRATVRLTPARFVTHTQLSEDAPGLRNQIRLADSTGLIVGDELRIGPAGNQETQKIIGFAADGKIELSAPVSAPISASGTPVEFVAPPDLRFTAVQSVDESVVRGVASEEDAAASQALGTGIQSRWLRGVLDRPITDDELMPAVEMAAPALRVSASGLLPDVAFTNTAPDEVTKAFYPFGAVPRIGDAFYIGNREALSKPNVTVSLEVAVQELPVPTLVWETSDGWTPLPSGNVADNTVSLTTGGVISLLVPPGGSQSASGFTTSSANFFVTLLRTRILSGRYRGAPQVTDFELIKTAHLTALVNPGDSSITLDFPNFAAAGQILLVDKEAVLITGSTSDTKLSVTPPFISAHSAGATVLLRGGRPVGALSQAAQAGTAKLAGPSAGLQNGDVLLIYDTNPLSTPEFSTVQTVTGANGAAGVTVAPPLRFTHGNGVTVAKLIDLNLFGLTNTDELNLNSAVSFLPFGEEPGQGDVFTLFLSGFESLFPLLQNPLFEIFTLGTAVLSNILAAPAPGAGQGQQAVSAGFVSRALPRLHITPQARVNFRVASQMKLPPLDLVWEFLGDHGWAQVDPRNVADDTNEFRINDGRDHLIVLSGISATLAEVNSIKNYWLRVRINAGSYGLPVDFVMVDPADPSKGFMVKPGTDNLNPPVLTKLTMNYVSERQPAILTQNGFLFSDFSRTAPGSSFKPFIPVGQLAPAEYADPDPAFYIGFDAAFPGQPVTLYFARSPQVFAGSIIRGIRSAPGPGAAASTLVWQYYDGTDWKVLAVLDLTNDFTEVGTLEFLTPPDIARFAKFDPAPLYWIRVQAATNQPGSNQPLDAPRLLGAFINTTTAVQAVTLSSEILGSSNGQPGQALATARSPVLPGQQIMILEPEEPPDKERDQIELEEGHDAIQLRLDSITGQPEIWVRWHEIDSFLRSDPHSRHYTMDHATGQIAFGDGVHGLIPPSGTNNITAAYRTGGGAAGNVGRGAVVQITSPLPGVAGVFNPVPADGGSDAETVSMALDRGPQTLRHRYHAVAAADIEWLARQADGTRVARARCIPNVNSELNFEPGWSTLIVVPRSTDPRPTPGAQLTRLVEDYLRQGTPIGLAATPFHINVIGPGFIQVTVVAGIVPRDVEQAQQVKQQAMAALAAFLHPLSGGPGGSGWDFGRNVYSSEVYQLLQAVPGVDHVASLTLIPSAGQRRLRFAPAISGGLPAGSIVSVSDRKKSALLGEAADSGDPIDHIAIKSFKEGDRITRALDVVVAADNQGRPSVSGNQIGVAPFQTDSCGFPRGSTITNLDGTRRATLAQAIPRSHSSGPSTINSIAVDDNAFLSALAANEVLTIFYPFPMSVTAVTMGVVNLGVQVEPYFVEASLPAGAVIASHDNRVRLPLSGVIDGNQTIESIELADFQAGDAIAVTPGPGGSPAFQALVQTVDSIRDIVFLEDNFLVYSGAHRITVVEH